MAGGLAVAVAIAWGASIAPAQTSTTLIGGGLTALPAITLGSNSIANEGFESGSAAPWSGGAGWSLDRRTTHTGAFSYRRESRAPSAMTTVRLEPGTYTFSAWVKTENLGDGVRLRVDFRPGAHRWLTAEIDGGTADWRRYEVRDLVITQPATVVLKLEDEDGVAGTAWFDDVKLEQQLSRPLDAFLLYPNFRGMLFDDAPAVLTFDVKVTPPGGDFSRHTVQVTLRHEATGRVVTTRAFPSSAAFVAELDGSGLEPGAAYLATLALIDAVSGAAVSAYPPYRVSRASAAARRSMNVSFDARGRVLIKGVPRFVLGIYDSGLGHSTRDSFWEQTLWSPTGERRMGDMKLNMYLNSWYAEAPLPAMNALMASLQTRGVMYLQTSDCGRRRGVDVDAYVAELGAHPGSAGYYTAEACPSTLAPGGFAHDAPVRRLDPDSIILAATAGPAELDGWRDVADIMSTEAHAMFGPEPAGGYNHRAVADGTAMSRAAVKDARPIMTVLPFSRLSSLGRWPTRAEMRSHAYMAIVEGARGLWWSGVGDTALAGVCTDWCSEKTQYMDNLRSVVNELAALEPVLLADDAPASLSDNPNTHIKTKVKVVNGQGYVLAYNASSSRQSATFTWNTAPGTVTVNAENRTVVASGRSFTDTFGPFAAHVYVIGNGTAETN